jgi:hypothetical protein
MAEEAGATLGRTRTRPPCRGLPPGHPRPGCMGPVRELPAVIQYTAYKLQYVFFGLVSPPWFRRMPRTMHAKANRVEPIARTVDHPQPWS